MSYVISAYYRAFGDLNFGFASCEGETYILKPLQVDKCAALADLGSLPTCGSAKVGDDCLGTGDCNTDASLKNCPTASGGASVYRKTDEGCMGGVCEVKAQALCWVSVLSFFATLASGSGVRMMIQ